jgi:hypothetical protein
VLVGSNCASNSDIARACIPSGRGAAFTLWSTSSIRLESEVCAAAGGGLANCLRRLDLVVLDELGYLPCDANATHLFLSTRRATL